MRLPATGGPARPPGRPPRRGAWIRLRSPHQASGEVVDAPWHFLYFLPLPQGHGSLRPTFGSSRFTWRTVSSPPVRAGRGGSATAAAPRLLLPRIAPKGEAGCACGAFSAIGGGVRGRFGACTAITALSSEPSTTGISRHR